ncbi:MAG: hypothetical protein KAR85_07695 [Methanosarcinales archaeon]|nr:hypothetical protein [Methanosarcinales archaeon]
MSRKMTANLCSGKTAFEVNAFTKIDLMQAAQVLKTIVVTPHILIVDIDGIEISLYPTGRMLVKHVKTEDEALKAAEYLLNQVK